MVDTRLRTAVPIADVFQGFFVPRYTHLLLLLLLPNITLTNVSSK